MLKPSLCIYGFILGVLLFQSIHAQDLQSGNGTAVPVVCLAIEAPNKYAGTTTGVYMSAIEKNDWKQINNGLTNTRVFTLQILSDSPTTLVAGTVEGIFVLQNNGTSWEKRSNGLTNPEVRSLAVLNGSLFAGTTSGGVFLSTDKGAGWSRISNGLPGDAVVYSLSQSGGNLYAGTQLGIFASSDDGATWHPVDKLGAALH